MIKRLLIAVTMLCAVTEAQVPVTPATIPHVTFVNVAGGPCAGCKLWTYTAGTTTPFATYVDATGTSVNTNPVTLDAAGGANLWLGRHSYKFILKDASGATIWTVDQVNAANLFPCAPANTIQIANTGVNGLNCDSTITVDPINHTLSVGVMSVNHVTIGALGTPTSWNFDTTTPATALASLGGGFSFPGAGIPNSTGTAWGTSYGISGTGNVALTTSPTFITPTLGAASATSVQVASGTAMTGNQGTGLLVQHSTGTTTTGHVAAFDASGNVIDSGSPGSTAPFSTLTDVTGSRTFSTAYHNTGTTPMLVIGYGLISGGSGDSTITCNVGASSPSTDLWSNVTTGTIGGQHVGFSCIVPPSYFYSVTANNLITSIGRWVEEQ